MKIVTFRTKKEADLIGIFIEQKEDYIIIERPFFIQYNSSDGTVSMGPFCIFSDQTQYKFSIRELQFVVPVHESIAKHFIRMIRAVSVSNPFSEEPEETFQDGSTDSSEDPHFGVQQISKSVH